MPPGSLYEDGRCEVGEKRETARGSLMDFLLRSLVYVARRGLIQPNLEGVTLQWLYLGELKVYEA